MQPLNDTNLEAILSRLNNPDLGAPILPTAIEYKSSVILTNGALLLEWPKKLVDMRMLQETSLLTSSSHSTTAALLREANHWTDMLIGHQKFHPVEEAEPGDCPDLEGCIAYRCRSTYCYFREEYISIVEAVLNNAKSPDIFKPTGLQTELNYCCHQPHGCRTDMVFLCPFTGKDLVGAIANTIMKEE